MPDHRFHTNTGPKTLNALAKLAGAEVMSGGDDIIEDVAPLLKAQKTDISFLDNIKYKDDFKATQAGACIILEKMKEFAPEGCNILISKNPYKSYALIAQAFYPQQPEVGNISEYAHIDPSANIGEGCVIEAGAVIGKNVEIGDKTKIGANASISHAIVGSGCNIYPGVRIGQDGFGFAIDPAGHVKVPQLGRVIIGDNVEIGSNTCIDRGSGPDTVIGDGTWIDNLVQIGHNVKVGRGCVIVAQSGIAGSTTLEDYVVVAAQSGVAGHLNIGMAAKIGAQSGVMRDVPAQTDVLGSPAVPVRQYMKQVACVRKLATKNKKI